jgi:hypothetical protein
LGGESWDGEEEGEIEEGRVGKVLIFWLLPMESPMEKFCRYTDGHSSFEFRDNNIKSCVLYSFFFFVLLLYLKKLYLIKNKFTFVYNTIKIHKYHMNFFFQSLPLLLFLLSFSFSIKIS